MHTEGGCCLVWSVCDKQAHHDLLWMLWLVLVGEVGISSSAISTKGSWVEMSCGGRRPICPPLYLIVILYHS